MPTRLAQQGKPAIIKLVIDQHFKYFFILLLLIATSVLPPATRGMAQSGGHTVFGDFRVDEGDSSQIRPINFIVILYTLGGRVVARQTVTNNGRYRFIDVPDGEYSVVVESENIEVARFRVTVVSPVRTDFRQDILMEWRENSAGKKRENVRPVTVIDTYQRGPANTALFEKAGAAVKKKDYDQAISFLRQILNTDPKDFEAWSELGTAFLSQDKADDAESAYLRALAEKPDYMLALINLGKLRLIQKQYEKAVETLDQAVRVQPRSATANYYLGEAYLQIKKGSKAVVYLREALNLDPVGRADAHLRLAALYNAAGMKDKAAAEYEDFLKKRPDHPAKKKLQQYIEQNKRP